MSTILALCVIGMKLGVVPVAIAFTPPANRVMAPKVLVPIATVPEAAWVKAQIQFSSDVATCFWASPPPRILPMFPKIPCSDMVKRFLSLPCLLQPREQTLRSVRLGLLPQLLSPTDANSA